MTIKKKILTSDGIELGPDHHQKFHFSDKQVYVLGNGHHPYIENPLVFRNSVRNFIEKKHSKS